MTRGKIKSLRTRILRNKTAQILFPSKAYLGISSQENYPKDNKDSGDSWDATNVYQILSLFKSKKIPAYNIFGDKKAQ